MPPPDLPIIDNTVLAELMASTGDDPEFVRELLETYLAETPEQLSAIAAAIEASDAAGLVRPAHTLKSSSATLGAMRLSALGREMETAGRSESLGPEVAAWRDAAVTTWESTVEGLRAWLEEHAS